jgi:hypothetical protein
MEALQAETNPGMSVAELWIELKIACQSAPSRSQFYEWLKACWITEPQQRGGVKQQHRYNQVHLNRLVRFHQLKETEGNLKAAQFALFEEMKQNPELYFED